MSIGEAVSNTKHAQKSRSLVAEGRTKAAICALMTLQHVLHDNGAVYADSFRLNIADLNMEGGCAPAVEFSSSERSSRTSQGRGPLSLPEADDSEANRPKRA